MGNTCTRRIRRHNSPQEQNNDQQQQPVNGVRNRQDIRQHLRENGYVGFEYIFRNTHAALRRGPEHSQCIADPTEVPPPEKLNASDVKNFTETRFCGEYYKKPIIHDIPDENEENGFTEIAPDPAIVNFQGFKCPSFLNPFVNSPYGVKIQLRFYASSVENQILDRYPEALHLFSHLKSLTLWYRCNTMDFRMEPHILLEENHGNVRERSLRLHKRRKMEIRYRLMKKRSFLVLAGKDFMLRLHRPSTNVSMESLEEGNGERPIATGTYTRLLDVNPNVALDYQVYIWRWFNECNRSP